MTLYSTVNVRYRKVTGIRLMNSTSPKILLRCDILKRNIQAVFTEVASTNSISAANFPPGKKGKGSPYSITERRVPELIPVLGSQPASDVSHKPDGRLPLLLSAVTPATVKGAANSFAAW